MNKKLIESLKENLRKEGFSEEVISKAYSEERIARFKINAKIEVKSPEQLIREFGNLVGSLEKGSEIDVNEFRILSRMLINSYLHFKKKADKFNRKGKPNPGSSNKQSPKKEAFHKWLKFRESNGNPVDLKLPLDAIYNDCLDDYENKKLAIKISRDVIYRCLPDLRKK